VRAIAILKRYQLFGSCHPELVEGRNIVHDFPCAPRVFTSRRPWEKGREGPQGRERLRSRNTFTFQLRTFRSPTSLYERRR
jgi:hypothetical protein